MKNSRTHTYTHIHDGFAQIKVRNYGENIFFKTKTVRYSLFSKVKTFVVIDKLEEIILSVVLMQQILDAKSVFSLIIYFLYLKIYFLLVHAF